VSDAEFETSVAAALQADVPVDAAAKVRVMERVRAAARELPRSHGGLPFRGARHSVVGLALAAGIGSITTLSTLLPRSDDLSREHTRVFGDSVVATLRDTLRLVRLIFDDPGARQVAVVGDFNAWRLGATPLVRDADTHRWSATLALRDGAHRYAFVVDGTRWVPDPDAERVRADDGRVYSLLHVSRVTN
jgi:hypothetical protein